MTTHQKRWIGLCALTLIGCAAWFAFRWPHNSLWYDETVNAYAATQNWPDLWRWTTIDFQLPLYLAGMKLWIAPFAASPVEVTEFALRVSSVFFAFLSVAGMLALGKWLVGALGGFASAVILAALPAFVYIAFEVRVYGFTFAAATWSYVFLWALLTRYGSSTRPLGRRYQIHLALYVVAIVCALYGHYTALFILPAQGLLILSRILDNWRRGSSWRRPLWIGLSALLLIGLAYAPWLPMTLRSGSLTHLYFDGWLSVEQVRNILLDFFATGQDRIAPANQWLTDAILWLLLICGIAWLLLKRRAAPFLFALAASLIPASILTMIVLRRAKLTGRYAWGMWIGMVLLAGLGVAALWLPERRRAVRWLPPAAALAFMASALWIGGLGWSGHHSDFRGAFAYLREHWTDGDLLVLRDGTLFSAAEFYRSPKPYIGLPADPITDVTHVLQVNEAVEALREKAAATKRVWLMAWQGDVMDPQSVTDGLLETISTRQTISGFGDVDLDLYTLSQPLSVLKAPTAVQDTGFPLPTGLTLQAAEIFTPTRLVPGAVLIIHAWWLRRDHADNDTRVSIRLIGADSKTYSQNDQPPAGWLYWSNQWTPGQLILGRYRIIIPGELPTGTARIQLVLYSVTDAFSPLTVDAGQVVVERIIE